VKTHSASQTSAEGVGPAAKPRNEVVLVGRLSAPPEVRTLPSGDVLSAFRLVVARPPGGGGRPAATPSARAAGVDTIDCVVWRGNLRRSSTGWAPGDILEVRGALRRRFWRSTGGPASRCEVEVAGARRLRRASG